MEPTTIGGVKGFVLTPRDMLEGHRNQLAINAHGGGHVYGPGESGAAKAMLMAACGGCKAIGFDCRMPPDTPHPAATDDAMAVWRGAVGMADPTRIAIVGTSTGGGMTLAMILRAEAEGRPPSRRARPGPT